MVKSSTVATGTVGSPGTYDPVLTVASAENQTVVSGNKVLSYQLPLNAFRTEFYYWEHPDVPEGKDLEAVLGGTMMPYTDSLQDAEGKLVFLKLNENCVDVLVA